MAVFSVYTKAAHGHKFAPVSDPDVNDAEYTEVGPHQFDYQPIRRIEYNSKPTVDEYFKRIPVRDVFHNGRHWSGLRIFWQPKPGRQ